jgi:hypothetical protein
MQELMSKLDTILMRCKAIGITLSIKKFKISKEVAFAGYVVKQGAIRASPERAIVLKEFPSPQNIHKLRSFLGLAQQLASFVPNLAHASEPLRHLLKKEMKYWSHDLQDAFATVVKILTCDLMLINFDPFWPTMLLRRIKTKRPRLCTGAHGDSDWQAEDQASDMRIAQPQPSLEILRRRQTRGPGSKARGGGCRSSLSGATIVRLLESGKNKSTRLETQGSRSGGRTSLSTTSTWSGRRARRIT